MRRLVRVAGMVAAVIVATATAASAHPLGNFTVNHLSRVTGARDGVTVRYVLDLAEIPAFALDRSLDAHGAPAHTTLAAWADSHAKAIAPQLQLVVLARVELADGRNDAAEDAAKRAAAIQPNPEVLGMLADAQAARGENDAAAATRDEIFAVARIGNAQHVNDRLIAVYEADHHVRVADAYAIAKRELSVRDDVYAEDTLAWAAARSGHWAVARTAIARALRYGIEDPRIRAHAAEIAAHTSG